MNNTKNYIQFNFSHRSNMFWYIIFCLFSIYKCQNLLGLDEGQICKENDINWLCSYSHNCTHVNLTLDRPNICSFDGLNHEPIICCPPMPVRLSEKYCMIFHNNSTCKPQLSSRASLNQIYSDLIWERSYPVNSTKQKRSLDVTTKHKHMAILGYGSNMTEWNCSGALISKRHILTSAKCLQNGDPDFARLGESDTSIEDERIQDKEIILCTPHPEYDNTYNDIAICELIDDVEFTDYVSPACLNSNFEINFPYATVTGFQKTETNSNSTVIQEVDISIINGPKCRQMIDDKNKVNATTQICAGEEQGVDACISDPGAPMVIESSKICLKTLIGITSVGKNSCISPNSAGIYTRVSHYLDWIEEIVWSEVE